MRRQRVLLSTGLGTGPKSWQAQQEGVAAWAHWAWHVSSRNGHRRRACDRTRKIDPHEATRAGVETYTSSRSITDRKTTGNKRLADDKPFSTLKTGGLIGLFWCGLLWFVKLTRYCTRVYLMLSLFSVQTLLSRHHRSWIRSVLTLQEKNWWPDHQM